MLFSVLVTLIRIFLLLVGVVERIGVVVGSPPRHVTRRILVEERSALRRGLPAHRAVAQRLREDDRQAGARRDLLHARRRRAYARDGSRRDERALVAAWYATQADRARRDVLQVPHDSDQSAQHPTVARVVVKHRAVRCAVAVELACPTLDHVLGILVVEPEALPEHLLVVYVDR